jgi:hypothetical protein
MKSKTGKWVRRARANSAGGADGGGKQRRPRHYSASIVSSVDGVAPAHWLADGVPYRLRYEVCVLLSRNSLAATCALVVDTRICAFLCQYAEQSQRAEQATVWFLNRYIERENSKSVSSSTAPNVVSLLHDTSPGGDESNAAEAQNVRSGAGNVANSAASYSKQIDQLVERFKKQFVTELNARAQLVFGVTLSPSNSTLPVLINTDHNDDDGESEFVQIAMITITNTDVLADNAQPRRLNRVLRQFASRADRFARVLFHNCNEGRKRLILNRGFVFANRAFEFLAYTKNQAFASMAWFVAPLAPLDDERAPADDVSSPEASPSASALATVTTISYINEHFSADALRGWMGDFSKVCLVCVCACARACVCTCVLCFV